MKIAIVSDTLFPHQVNGVAKVVKHSAERLRERGHDVLVVSVTSVPTVPFWGYKGERIALPLGAAYRKILQFKPDVIHAHTPFVLGWEALYAGKKLDVPLIATHHTFFDHYLKHVKLDTSLVRSLSWKYLVKHFNHFDLVLSPSDALIAGMRKFGFASDGKVFPNSIDTDFFVPSDRKKVRDLIYMGRLSYEKSIDQILETLAQVKKTLPEVTLTLVGDGPERRNLEKLTKKLGLENNVIFTGMLHGEELLEALQCHKVFITASKSENMPLSILEAMATGLPVVGVNSLGVPEIVRDGSEGYIVEPDDIQAMAAKILTFLQHEDMRKVFALRARKRAEEFGEKENAQKLEAIYTELINE